MAGQPGFVFGRKRRKDIWKNFHYIEVEEKTDCVVEKDGKKCVHKITGKNTTNLKRHLKAFHNETEASQDINLTLLSILESSYQLMRLWLMCLILTSALDGRLKTLATGKLKV